MSCGDARVRCLTSKDLRADGNHVTDWLRRLDGRNVLKSGIIYVLHSKCCVSPS